LLSSLIGFPSDSFLGIGICTATEIVGLFSI
jgi:hypothetical protein